MKALSFLFLGTLLAPVTNAQSWDWAAQSQNSTARLDGQLVAADQFGNVFIYGSSQGSAQFGQVTVDSGQFIAKFSSSGVAEWVRNYPEPSMYTYHGSLMPDQQGGFYIVSPVYGSYQAEDTTLLQQEHNTYAVVRFNSSGQRIWAGTGRGYLSDVIADTDGHIYILSSNATDTARFNQQVQVIGKKSWFQ